MPLTPGPSVVSVLDGIVSVAVNVRVMVMVVVVVVVVVIAVAMLVRVANAIDVFVHVEMGLVGLLIPVKIALIVHASYFRIGTSAALDGAPGEITEGIGSRARWCMCSFLPSLPQ